MKLLILIIAVQIAVAVLATMVAEMLSYLRFMKSSGFQITPRKIRFKLSHIFSDCMWRWREIWRAIKGESDD